MVATAWRKIQELFHSYPRWIILLLVLIAAILLVIAFQLSSIFEARLLAQRRSDVSAHLNGHSTAFNVALERRISLLEGLRVFVQAELENAGEIVPQEFDLIAAGLYKSSRGLRMLAIAPGGIQNLVYPLEQNQAVVGRNLLQDTRPDFQADMATTIHSGQVVVSGPADLPQGGVGLVARQAVSRGGYFWGFVVLIVDPQDLLQEAGLLESHTDLNIALRNEKNQVFFGSPAVFQNDPIVDTLYLPTESWQIAALPAGGWRSGLSESMLIFNGGIALIMVMAMALSTLIFTHQISLEKSITLRTSELAQELSVRRQAEEELRLSQDRYRSLVEASPDAIILTDLKGQAVLANQRAGELFELQNPDEAAGLDIRRFLSKKRRSEIMQAFRNLIATFSAEMDLLTFQGRSFPAEVSAAPVADGSGKPIGFTAVVRDISERKQRERQREAIATISQALRNAVQVDEVLSNTLSQMEELVQIEGAGFFLMEPDQKSAVCTIATGAWSSWNNVRITPSECPAWTVLENGLSYINPNIQRMANPNCILRIGGLAAVAGVALYIRKQSLGALWVGRSTPFTPDEENVLHVVADLAASTILRARLLEETQRRLQHLEALHEIDQAIVSHQDTEAKLSLLLEKCHEQLGVDSGAIYLLDRAAHTLNFIAQNGFTDDLKTGGHAPQPVCAELVMEKHALQICADVENCPLGRSCAARLSTADPRGGGGFVSYFGLPLEVDSQLVGVMELFCRRPLQLDGEQTRFLEALGVQAAIAIQNATLLGDLQRSNEELLLAYEKTLEGWALALELRDRETEGHTRRAADLCVRLGRAFGIGEEALVNLRRGVLLHDIGKLAVPDRILLKPGPLDEEEWQVMRMHPTYARELIEQIPYLHAAQDIPYSHHERWDGSGYPQGLSGEDIPLAARIFSVVDVWDALTSNRPYRPAWPFTQAREYMRQQAGRAFDPRVVEEFLKII